MKTVELQQVTTIIAGQSPESSTYNSIADGLPFFQGKADFQEKFPKVRIWCNSIKRKEAIPGDILMSVRAPVGSVNICNQKCIIGRGLSAIRSHSNLNNYFLYYYLKFNEKKVASLGTGSTFQAITQTTLKRLEIPLPPLDDQIRIATLLSKVENLISSRREQLKQLDELLKSVFLEMFGDPVRNEKRWEKKKIIEFACVKIGPFGSLLHVSDYISNGIPLINPSHIVKGEIRPDSSLTITSTMFNELTSYHLSENDIVVARRGEIGRCALVRDSAKLLCGTGSMFIRIESGYVPDFLQFQIFRTSLKDLLLSKSKGVTMQNLNSTTLETLHVIFPPLDLQKQFAAIIHKVENIKSSYQQSLDELKFLYGTLSQKAFKGELDLSLVRLVEEGESLTRITSESSNSESSY